MENDPPDSKPLKVTSNLIINNLYDITAEAKDVRSPSIVTFTDKKTKESFSIPLEALRGYSGDYWGGTSGSAINDAGRLLHDLGKMKTEVKINFANINKINPALKRFDNDGTDVGAPFPNYCLNDSIPWTGWDPESEEDIDASSDPEIIANYIGDKIITYTPADDEVILQWIDADLDYNPGNHRKAGWGLFFYGRQYFQGLDSEEPLYFAEWDDLEGIANILENMKDQEALKVTFALLGRRLEE